MIKYITKLVFMMFLGCSAIAIVIQNHTRVLPMGVFNTNRTQIDLLANILLLIVLAALIVLTFEFFRNSSWRFAAMIRWAIVFAILLDVFLLIGDRLIMTGDEDGGRGAYYEDRLSDGTIVILRRFGGGVPVDFCKDSPGRDYRVLFLGDSYTEGSGRAAPCNYPDVVERVMAARWQPDTRVINAGVSAYGPIEALNLLKWYREKDCRFDAIVYNLFLENDFTDNLPGTERRVVAGIIFRFPKSLFLRTFHPLNSRIFRWALYLTYVTRMSEGAKNAVALNSGECDPDPETVSDVTPFLAQLIRRRLEGSRRVRSSEVVRRQTIEAITRMREIAHATGVPFFLVVFPDRIMADPDLQRLMGVDTEALVDPRAIESFVYQSFFDTPLIDVSNVLAARSGMYRRSDTHLSDVGNQTAGRYVGEELARRLSAME